MQFKNGKTMKGKAASLAWGTVHLALLSTGEDHPIGLFGYLLLLNAGLAWVAYRKSWPVLSVPLPAARAVRSPVGWLRPGGPNELRW